MTAVQPGHPPVLAADGSDPDLARPVVDLTIAIVSYRSLALLERCLQTLPAATRGLRIELSVIENGTGEPVAAAVRRHVPRARVHELPRSIAFSAAVNRALADARGRHVALLNPDTLLEPASLTRLVEHLDEHPEVGIVGPRVWDDAERTSLQRSFRSFPGARTALCHRYSLLARLWPHNPWTRAYLGLDADRDSVQRPDWVSGCCLVVRRELFERLGGLDERYPMFCEDVDLCRRARALGFEVAWEPRAEIVHFVGGSRRRAPLRSEWLRHRSITHYVCKFGGRARPRTWLLVAGVWARFLLRAALPGRTR